MMIMITIITTIINIVMVFINFHDQQVGGSNENGERKHADDTGQHPCKGGHDDDGDVGGDDDGGVHDGDDVVEEAGYVGGHDGEHLKVPAMKENMMFMMIIDNVKKIPKQIARQICMCPQ